MRGDVLNKRLEATLARIDTGFTDCYCLLMTVGDVKEGCKLGTCCSLQATLH